MATTRLFEIVNLLIDKNQVTAKELAERFEVSVRTIYRDVERLSGAGIPIYMTKGKGGGISLLSNYVLDKTFLTEQEKKDILSSLSALVAVNVSNMEDTTRKFKNIFGSAYTEWIEVDFGLWSDGKNEATLFQMSKQSILQKQVVTFQYISVKGEVLIREVEPLKLVFKGTSWYLYGFCRLRMDFRFFRLKRMRDLQITSEHYVRSIPESVFRAGQAVEPVDTINENIGLQEHSTTDQATKPANLINVKIKVTPPNLYRAYDDFEDCRLQEDGTVLAQATFDDADWLVEHLLDYGDTCEILEPEELRERMRIKLEKMLGKYRGS